MKPAVSQIVELITEALSQCTDLDLLDLVYKLILSSAS